MKFRTEVIVNPKDLQIEYADQSFFIGSCFSVNIFRKLKALKFNVVSNPFGIVYNPISLANQLNRILKQPLYAEEDLQIQNERWFSFDHHSDFSFTDKQACLESINTELKLSRNKLVSANFIFITLGTSWVYTWNETGQTVSNCHKLPAKKFTKTLAKTEEMVAALSSSISQIQKINSKAKFVFSISPVRHLGDGFFENQLSKGRLFDTINQLNDLHPIDYFPAYEIVLDDLRDYRFFNPDLIHPSEEAIRYIWEKFSTSFISTATQSTIQNVEKVIRACSHRPFSPNTVAHQQFIQKTIQDITQLEKDVPGDFMPELQQLKKHLID